MINFANFKSSLNPCCSGRWSRTEFVEGVTNELVMVLILVVVEDGLVRLILPLATHQERVLILVVVEDGLVLK